MASSSGIEPIESGARLRMRRGSAAGWSRLAAMPAKGSDG